MPSKEEKQKRKLLLDEINKKAREKFEKNLPMEREKFEQLFDYLDQALTDRGCDDTNSMTKEFLKKLGQDNIENILKWLSDNGGYCDCEILGNVEELFL